MANARSLWKSYIAIKNADSSGYRLHRFVSWLHAPEPHSQQTTSESHSWLTEMSDPLFRTDCFSAPDWLLRSLTPTWVSLFILLFLFRRFSQFVWSSCQSRQRSPSRHSDASQGCRREYKIPSLATHPRTHTETHAHIYLSIYLYIVTRKYDTLIHSPSYGEGGATRRPLADYSSKQNSGSRRAVSLQPSLLVQADIGMGEPHSLLAMYASAEKQTCDHDWYWGRNGHKANT